MKQLAAFVVVLGLCLAALVARADEGKTLEQRVGELESRVATLEAAANKVKEDALPNFSEVDARLVSLPVDAPPAAHAAYAEWMTKSAAALQAWTKVETAERITGMMTLAHRSPPGSSPTNHLLAGARLQYRRLWSEAMEARAAYEKVIEPK